MNRLRVTLTACALVSALSAVPAFGQSDPYLGEIMLVPYTFCPRGWTEANGQLLPITQYTALFSLIGNTYGGDGRIKFALPNLQAPASGMRYCIAITGMFPSKP